MGPRIGHLVLLAIVITGCQNRLYQTTEPNRGPVTTINIETTEPRLEDGRYRVDVKGTTSEHYTADQLAQVPVGQLCTVEMTTAGRVIRGRIEKTSEQLLVLSDAEEIITSTSEQGVPNLQKIPYVNRMFKNVGIANEHRFLGPETISASEIKSIAVERETASAVVDSTP